ncbi:hypothetical protein BGZ63DRAFT_174791 [Mariannaea sp. PMI_226]|nr:hypothetical protein BGZ63DRAFT_174791 [Mariannaea sp. PMI_226]
MLWSHWLLPVPGVFCLTFHVRYDGDRQELCNIVGRQGRLIHARHSQWLDNYSVYAVPFLRLDGRSRGHVPWVYCGGGQILLGVGKNMFARQIEWFKWGLKLHTHFIKTMKQRRSRVDADGRQTRLERWWAILSSISKQTFQKQAPILFMSGWPRRAEACHWKLSSSSEIAQRVPGTAASDCKRMSRCERLLDGGRWWAWAVSVVTYFAMCPTTRSVCYQGSVESTIIGLPLL